MPKLKPLIQLADDVRDGDWVRFKAKKNSTNNKTTSWSGYFVRRDLSTGSAYFSFYEGEDNLGLFEIHLREGTATIPLNKLMDEVIRVNGYQILKRASGS